MKKAPLCLLLYMALLINSGLNAQDKFSPIDFVNTLMGTNSKPSLSNGNTYPCIGLPWGMNYWTPQTGENGNGWQYSYTADKIVGFKQTHQPSPWMNDYGQFSIMPVNGIKITQGQRASWFTHKTEIATPYYYNVYLADAGVTAEITPTERCAIMRFNFLAADSAAIVIDAFNKGSFIKVISSENKIVGYSTKNSGGVHKDFKNYFVIQFDRPFSFSRIWSKDSLIMDKHELSSEHSGAIVGFSLPKNDAVTVKVASSFISIEQAALNMKREIGHKDLMTIKQKAKESWNKQLSKIKAEGNMDHLRTFYSCLYRTLLFPQKHYEINNPGEIVHYSPYTGNVEKGYFYAGTGFWDTFRALYPLLNFLYPAINKEMQEGLINAYQESGWLPEWSSPGYRNIMIGNNSASVVADAYIKGLKGYNIETLYQALVHGANNEGPIDAVGRKGAGYYNSIGYVPYNVGINESAARTLEYAYNDFCIAQLAKALKKPQSEIDFYLKRSQNYKKLFDSEALLMRGRNKEGDFQAPFNPFKWGDAFTEGNSWHYTWSVFQDIEGLKKLMGGNEMFVKMLDSVFALPPIFDESYYKFVIHEIREMQIINMGQYAHGNQPIQHMTYLYNYAGQPWKTQRWVREVMERLYKPTPDGYCGDEDNGQTSAWYIFSALGFYPVCPATNEYVLGAPLFNKVTVHFDNGKTLTIKAESNSSENVYVEDLQWNTKNVSTNFLEHEKLISGGVLHFKMCSKPNYKRGIDKAGYPFSLTER